MAKKAPGIAVSDVCGARMNTVGNVVNRRRGGILAQVIENAAKINVQAISL